MNFELLQKIHHELEGIHASNAAQTLQGIHQELKGIHAASVAQTQLLANASTYALGYAIAFGMNYAVEGKVLPAAFQALLSWVNVGYLLVRHLGHALPVRRGGAAQPASPSATSCSIGTAPGPCPSCSGAKSPLPGREVNLFAGSLRAGQRAAAVMSPPEALCRGATTELNRSPEGRSQV